MNPSEPESRALVADLQSLVVARPPSAVIEEAREAAKALTDVLKQKSHAVVMNGEQYLELEDWELIGRFYGVTFMADGDPEYVQLNGPDGPIRGFKASAFAIRHDGATISRATAYCLDDEEKWGERNKYVWGYYLKSTGEWSEEEPPRSDMIWIQDETSGKSYPKKERRLLGKERVPTFQLASMAQTRAGSKAMANVLRWVPMLAGIKGTSAEELPSAEVEVINRDEDKRADAATVVNPGPADDKDIKAWRSILMGNIKKVPGALERLTGEARRRDMDEARWDAFLTEVAGEKGLAKLTFGQVWDALPPIAGGEAGPEVVSAPEPVEGTDGAPVGAAGEETAPSSVAERLAEVPTAESDTRTEQELLARSIQLGITDMTITFFTGNVGDAVRAQEREMVEQGVALPPTPELD